MDFNDRLIKNEIDNCNTHEILEDIDSVYRGKQLNNNKNLTFSDAYVDYYVNNKSKDGYDEFMKQYKENGEKIISAEMIKHATPLDNSLFNKNFDVEKEAVTKIVADLLDTLDKIYKNTRSQK